MFLSIVSIGAPSPRRVFYASEDPASAHFAVNALLASWALGLSLDERPEELS